MEVDGEIPAEEAEEETANASEDASQHQSDFLTQLARFDQRANLAQKIPRKPHPNCARSQAQKEAAQVQNKVHYEESAQAHANGFASNQQKANLQAIQEGLAEAGAPKKSRPSPRSDNPIEEVIESPFHTANEHLGVPRGCERGGK